MKVTNEQKGSTYVILSGFLYGLLGYFGISIIAENFTIYNMLFFRFSIASIFIILFSIISKKKLNLKFSPNLFKAFILGSICYSSCATLYFLSARYIGTGLAVVISFTYPVMIMLYNWLFKQYKVSNTYYCSIALLIIGLFLLIDLNEIKFNLYGIVFAILSSISYATYIIYNKQQSTEISPLSSTFIISLGSCIICLIAALLDNNFILATKFYTWFNIIGMGIICTALPILFFLEGLKYIKSEKAAILSVLEPVCVTIFGALLLNEKLDFAQVLGVITILGGALIAQAEELKQ